MTDPDLDPDNDDLKRAITASRPEPAIGFEDRLRAAAVRPRGSLAWPIALGAAFAAAAIALVFLMQRDEPAPIAKRVPITEPDRIEPAGSGSPGVVVEIEKYQAVLDGTVASLALDPAQLAKVQAIGDDLGKQRAQLVAEREVAAIDLRRELSREPIDAVRAGAVQDRIGAAKAKLDKAELLARIAVRAVLTPNQRALVEAAKQAETITPNPVATGPGQVQILSEPQGAEVTVDGRAVGRAPLEMTIAPGQHQVRVQQPGYLTEERLIEVSAGNRLSLSVKLAKSVTSSAKGTVTLKTKPAARVFVDGADTGKSTPVTLQLPQGRHKVTFAIGGDKYTFPVSVGDTPVSLVKDLSGHDDIVDDPFEHRTNP